MEQLHTQQQCHEFIPIHNLLRDKTQFTRNTRKQHTNDIVHRQRKQGGTTKSSRTAAKRQRRESSYLHPAAATLGPRSDPRSIISSLQICQMLLVSNDLWCSVCERSRKKKNNSTPFSSVKQGLSRQKATQFTRDATDHESKQHERANQLRWNNRGGTLSTFYNMLQYKVP